MMIEITIYDMLGNIITKIVKQSEGPGHSFIQWDANNDQGYPVSAGVYFYKIVAGDFFFSTSIKNFFLANSSKGKIKFMYPKDIFFL